MEGGGINRKIGGWRNIVAVEDKVDGEGKRKQTDGKNAQLYTATAVPSIYSFSGNCAASTPISTFMYL